MPLALTLTFAIGFLPWSISSIHESAQVCQRREKMEKEEGAILLLLTWLVHTNTSQSHLETSSST